ncbi:MAG: hypothetical protein OK474_04580 [Thaumarchaeota archaeon]|nr:hypothetical protein [Nitrososphaerota archaeon]
MIVIAVVIVLTGAIAAGFYLVNAKAPATSSSVSSTRTSSSSSSHSTATTAISTSSTTAVSGLKTYSGTFQFINPLGPSGERTFSNNDTVQTYGSVQNGSGSFTFSLTSGGLTGSGSGHGILTVTTTGFCSGQTSFPYTFNITDATTLLGGNLTVFIGNPIPANFTVPLTCTGPTTGVFATGNTDPYLAIYPNELTLAISVAPVTISENLSGGISYTYTVTPTN